MCCFFFFFCKNQILQKLKSKATICRCGTVEHAHGFFLPVCFNTSNHQLWAAPRLLPLRSLLLNTCKGFLEIRIPSEIKVFSMTTGETFTELVLFDQQINDRQSHDGVRAAPQAVSEVSRNIHLDKLQYYHVIKVANALQKLPQVAALHLYALF